MDSQAIVRNDDVFDGRFKGVAATPIVATSIYHMVKRQSHPKEHKAYIYTKDFKTNLETYDFGARYLRHEIQSRPLELEFAVSWLDDRKAELPLGIVQSRIASYVQRWSPFSTPSLAQGCLGPFRLAALLHAKSSKDPFQKVHQSVYLERRMTMHGIHRRFVLDHTIYAWEGESAPTYKSFNLYQYRCSSRRLVARYIRKRAGDMGGILAVARDEVDETAVLLTCMVALPP